MVPEQIYEILVRPVKELSPQAQEEVREKLASKDAKFLAKYKGFASITYVAASPLHIKSVDPIEGVFGDLFAEIMSRSGSRSAEAPAK